MDLIDGGIANLNDFLKSNLPPTKLTDLLTDGLIAGIGGVLIFVWFLPLFEKVLNKLIPEKTSKEKIKKP